MTEKERQELDQLRKEGKLITGLRCKKLMRKLFMYLSVFATLVLVGGVLTIIGSKQSNFTVFIIGIILSVIGMVIFLFPTLLFLGKVMPKTSLYFQLKRKHPEYFMEDWNK